MIYGATGDTGTLVAEEAVRRGHKPVLAGRSEQKLMPLAERLGLPWVVANLEDQAQFKKALAGIDAVVNIAGPFMATAPALVQACLSAGTHYLDISGEVPALQHLLAHDEAARKRGIALIGGVGFGSMATNGLAKYVADQLPGATTLEVAVKADNQQSSREATKSTLQVLARGGRVYRNGRLVPFRLGKGLTTLQFPDGSRDILPVPSGDLVAAYHATGIPNITAYIPFRRAVAPFLPLVQGALSIQPIRRRLEAAIEKRGANKPVGEESRRRTSYSWARATDQNGRQVEAWLELGEGYQFTAASSVLAVTRVLRDRPTGTLMPAQAFGWDFVLGIEGVRRWPATASGHTDQTVIASQERSI
jgi:short subunit dehydrogenase-like uncharacterized protein